MATSNGGNRHLRRAVRVSLAVFVAAGVAAYLSQSAMHHAGLVLALAVLVLIIAIGVLADIIGTAITAAEETPFHAMAAKRLSGARQALWMVRHADRVSNFFEDILGDIAGTVSGAAAATIALALADLMGSVPAALHGRLNDLTDILMVAVVAALAVGGKAAGKGIAIAHANAIVFRVAVVVAWLEKVLPWSIANGKPRKPSRGRTNS